MSLPTVTTPSVADIFNRIASIFYAETHGRSQREAEQLRDAAANLRARAEDLV